MCDPSRILLIEPDGKLANQIETALRDQRMELIKCAVDGNPIRHIDRHKPHLVIAPCNLILDSIKDLHRCLINQNGEEIPLIVVSEMGPFERVARCVREGIDWFIHKPFEATELVLLIQSALATLGPRRNAQARENQLALQYPFGTVVACSKAMREAIARARQVAPKPTTALLLGSSGTGKELLARAIHYHSNRRQGPFLPVNCGSLPEPLLASELFGHTRGAFTGAYTGRRGLLQAASGGTLFLDEIGEAPRQLQMDLLRVVQDQVVRSVGSDETRRVDVRLIVATNRDLEQAVRRGEFREDLYYRVNVFPIHIPDLRDRKEDIPILVQYFLMKYSEQLNSPVRHISQEALDTLLEYDWPGNVRELESAVQHALVLATGRAILRNQLPPAVRKPSSPVPAGKGIIPRLEEAERELIIRALRETNNNRTETARLLGIHRSSLHRKIQRCRISTANPHASIGPD
jgi:two-component system response regulator AtoC